MEKTNDSLQSEIDRLKEDEKLLLRTLREEFLVNTENYPREYHALFSEKFNRVNIAKILNITPVTVRTAQKCAKWMQLCKKLSLFLSRN